MAIRFACAGCGKIHRVPDHYAGRPGRCGKCGLRFVAPGTTPDTSNVFVPNDDSDDLDDIQLMDRPVRRWKGVGGATLIGLLVGLALIACLFLARDGIVSSVPGLAPLMPPKADPPRRFPARQPEGPFQFDFEAGKALGAAIAFVVQFLALIVLPLSLPAILSRYRLLSVGRWLIMSAVCVFFAFTSGAFLSALLASSTIDPNRPSVGVMIMAVVALYSLVMSFFGIPGCLIAAAVHPKDTPETRGSSPA